MYVGQTKQFLEVQSKKLTTQHNMAASRSQMCMGAKPPYPMQSTTVTNTPRERISLEITEQRQKCSQRLCQGRPVWMSET